MFYCWMAAGGRWCCLTIVGPADVVMELLEDGARLRAIAWILDVPRLLSADYGDDTMRVENAPGDSNTIPPG